MLRKRDIAGRIIAGIMVCMAGYACSTPEAVQEARQIVAQADSLRAEGQMYDDSTQLAQAYIDLGRWQWVYSTDYAHACYHYGRLLRAKDNPVAAMECFINATHSRTHDYHILGRVYSNMGEIAHLAGKYQLSYDMFERSAECFLKNEDTIAYYYGLNDMAFELAEQGKKEETLELLNNIDYSDKELVSSIYRTKAVLYRNVEQYDSAIYYAKQSEKIGWVTSSCTIIQAQAFAKLEKTDSALFYANIVLNLQSASYQNTFNALYIVSHFDSTLCSEKIKELTSLREDVRYYQYEPEKELLTQAIQLLEQDLNQKPDMRWLYAIIATALVIGVGISIYVYSKRKKRQLLSQQIDDLENMNKTNMEQMKQKIFNRCFILAKSSNIKDDLCWNDYKQMCNIVNQQFGLIARKLQETYHFSEREIRLCVLIMIDGFTSKQLAELLYYAESGVRNLKSNTAKKLGTNGKEMHQFLVELALQ